MRSIGEFEILETLHEQGGSSVYRARRRGGSDTVLVKLLSARQATAADIDGLRGEYERIRAAEVGGIAEVIDVREHDGRIAVFYKDSGGVPLGGMLGNGAIDITLFLTIAAALSKTIGELHRRKILHGDLFPGNIYIDGAGGACAILGSGIERPIAEETDDPSVLAYLAPEQSGRMNRVPDHRSDLYSLGVVFYHMLTGRLPFPVDEPLGIIHSHLARTPALPEALNPAVPRTLSGIVMKLLAKSPEDRYQNGLALHADILECRKRLQSGGRINDFEIAVNDIPPGFVMTGLVGRDAEKKSISDCVDRISRGDRELILVCGPAGIGKTALVGEIRDAVRRAHARAAGPDGAGGMGGYFVQGKFDQHAGDIPYSAVAEAFGNLVSQLLTEGAERIAYWRAKLMAGLGPNAKIITDLVPDLTRIIGAQPDLSSLDPQKARNRFNFAVKAFIAALAAEARIVLFLDDLQWADPASLDFLTAVAPDPELAGLVIIGAYRDDEVSPSHPLAAALDAIGRSVLRCRIALTVLDEGRVNELVARAVKYRSDTLPLAREIHAKTGGNPFFILQFMRALVDADLLRTRIGVSRGRTALEWDWDLAAISRLPVTDNVADFLAERIAALPGETRTFIQAASCVGAPFDADFISRVCGWTRQESLRRISRAMRENLLVPAGGSFQFSHDRIREAVYSRIAPPERNALHSRIGRVMLEITPPDALDENLIPIVDQLNHGALEREDEEGRYRLAELNLRAGIRAQSAMAYASALKYLKQGIGLLEEARAWETRYDLALPLHVEAMKAASLCADYAEMERFSEIVLTRARTLLDRAVVHEAKMQSLIDRSRLQDGIELGLKVLKEFGVKLPARPKRHQIALGFIKSRIALSSRKIESLVDLPQSGDPRVIALMKILDVIGTAAFYSRPELLPLTILKSFELTLANGHTSSSPFMTFMGYGLVLINIGDIDGGYRFGNIALELLEKLDVAGEAARTVIAVNVFIRHWKEHLGNTLEPLLAAHRRALESGDWEWAGLSLGQYSAYLFFTGARLGEVQSSLKTCMRVMAGLSQEHSIHIMEAHAQCVLNLMGEADDPCRLKGGLYDEDVMLPRHAADADKIALFTVSFYKLILFYLFGRYREAVAQAEAAGRAVGAVPGMVFIPVFHFFDSLARTALYDGVPVKEKKRLLKAVLENRKKMEKWAFHAPSNNGHRLDLMDAEIARLQGRCGEAEKLYDAAARGARENRYIHEEAVTWECAARFYAARRMAEKARESLFMAHGRYAEWGAAAKTAWLERIYPEAGLSGRKAEHGKSALDLSTVIKASQALSGEIDLGLLLEKMLRIALENAGAQRGALLLEKSGALFIEADGSVDGEIHVLQSLPIGAAAEQPSEKLPVSVVSYVFKSGESVVLDDAQADARFGADPYFLSGDVKSVLCVAIRNKGKSTGVLYLENRLASHVFTADRLELLGVLSAQAGISIENALLYAELKKAMAREIGYRDVELRSHRLELELLKKTIQPHFLLNTLTALRAWLMEKPEKSVRLIDALADELRPIVSHSAEKLIPLKEEVDLCRAHLEVMGLRLDREYTLTTEGIKGDETVPPLVFHTLVENAFTHADPAAFSLFQIEKTETESGVRYTFMVDTPPVEKRPVREGTGLKYIRARLEESYPGRWTLDSMHTGQVWQVVIQVAGKEGEDRP